MQQTAPQTSPRRQTGLTLIECLIGVTIACLAAGAVLPGYGRMTEKRHLEGAAAQLETDIQFTRSMAVSLDESLRLRVQQDAGGSCYVVHRGSANSCTCSSSGAPVCITLEALIREVRFAAPAGVQMQSNVSSMLFTSTQGTVTPTGTLRLTGREGRSLHVVVNLMGRARTCTPAGAVGGYPTC